MIGWAMPETVVPEEVKGINQLLPLWVVAVTL